MPRLSKKHKHRSASHLTPWVFLGLIAALVIASTIQVQRRESLSLESRAVGSPTPANSQWLKYEDDSPLFFFKSGPARFSVRPSWDVVRTQRGYQPRAGTSRQCQFSTSEGCFATLDLTNQAVEFDQLSIGFASGPNRSEADIYVDNVKIGSADSFSAEFNTNYRNYKPWTSTRGAFGCGKHVIKVVPNGRTGRPGKAFMVDYIDVKLCNVPALTPTHSVTPTLRPNTSVTPTPSPRRSPTPMPGVWRQIEDTDSRFKFISGAVRTSKGYPNWDRVLNQSGYVLRGGSARQCVGLNNVGCYAQLDLANSTVSFNQIKLGFTHGPNRTEADIYVDGIRIGAVDSYNRSQISDYRKYRPWISPINAISCGKHVIRIVPNRRTGINQKAFTLDYLDIRTCQ